jgi:hypothetical protein
LNAQDEQATFDREFRAVPAAAAEGGPSGYGGQ